VRGLWEQKKLTLVFIEHDMDIVFQVASTIRVLCYGRVLAEGTPDEIRNNQAGDRRLSRHGGARSMTSLLRAERVNAFLLARARSCSTSILALEGKAHAGAAWSVTVLARGTTMKTLAGNRAGPQVVASSSPTATSPTRRHMRAPGLALPMCLRIGRCFRNTAWRTTS